MPLIDDRLIWAVGFVRLPRGEKRQQRQRRGGDIRIGGPRTRARLPMQCDENRDRLQLPFAIAMAGKPIQRRDDGDFGLLRAAVFAEQFLPPAVAASAEAASFAAASRLVAKAMPGADAAVTGDDGARSGGGDGRSRRNRRHQAQRRFSARRRAR